MRRKIFAGVLIILVNIGASVVSEAQILNMPAEIDRIMEASAFDYVLNEVKVHRSGEENPVIEQGHYLHHQQGWIKIETSNRLVTEKEQKYHNEVSRLMNTGDLKKAKKVTQTFQNQFPDSYKANLLMAQILVLEGDDENAIEWFKNAIQLNGMSYEAHWGLGRIYRKEGFNRIAIDHLLNAHFLNRNHPEIKQDLGLAFQQTGKRMIGTELEPAYSIKRGEDGSVIISAASLPYLYYGKCKAVWQFESGHHQEAEKLYNQNFCMLKEKEALLNGIIGYLQLPKDQKSDFPEFTIAQKALQHHLINEYILYEIRMRKDPGYFYTLTPPEIEKIKTYFLKIRVEDKNNMLSGN